MFEVRLSRNAEKFVENCDAKLKTRLLEFFKALEETPVPAKQFDLKKIAGGDSDRYRVRLSSFRAVYTVYWKEKIIRVLKIERRKGRTYDF
ncbi:MAG: type II toxin-antitoxin system RelE/ParE family toxin [archaeon]|nr:type II toxin-antitoxin system RelE/ParE family toxin [archaeon]